jgi:hypothetical protein
MTDAPTWESDHQRSVLVHLDSIHGTTLADEFPFGCDTIEHVAEALIALRGERRYAELMAYVRHKPDCVVGMAAGALSEACDCGLRDLLTRAFPDEAKP